MEKSEQGLIKAESVFGISNYEEGLNKSQEVAVALMAYVKTANKIKESSGSVNIQGNEYLCANSWKFIGGQLGLMEKIVDGQRQEAPRIWVSKADLVKISTGIAVGSGAGVCFQDEKKYKKDGTVKQIFLEPHAAASMSQTRAISKAFQNTIGFIPQLAGFAGTPAEEMMEAEYKMLDEEKEVKPKQTEQPKEELEGEIKRKKLADEIAKAKKSTPPLSDFQKKLEDVKKKFPDQGKEETGLLPAQIAMYKEAIEKCRAVPGLQNAICSISKVNKWSELPESNIKVILTTPIERLTEMFMEGVKKEIYTDEKDMQYSVVWANKAAGKVQVSKLSGDMKIYSVDVFKGSCTCIAGGHSKECKHKRFAGEYNVKHGE